MLVYEHLPAALVRAVPELRVPFEQEKRWWGKEPPPPHVVFGNLLSPFLAAELARGSRPEVLARLFAFVEELAQHPDVRIREVAQQSVLADICGERVGKLEKLIGIRSRELMEEYCSAYHQHKE